LLPHRSGAIVSGYNLLNPAAPGASAFGPFGADGQFAAGSATSPRPLYETQSLVPQPIGSMSPDATEEEFFWAAIRKYLPANGCAVRKSFRSREHPDFSCRGASRALLPTTGSLIVVGAGPRNRWRIERVIVHPDHAESEGV